MTKRDVIVFGGGRVFEEKEKLIVGSYNILAIADNKKEEVKIRHPEYNVISPDGVIEFKDVGIIVTADAIIDITLQIASIIGCEECEKRVSFARFVFPVSDWEIEISKCGVLVKVLCDEVRVLINRKDNIIMSDPIHCYKDIYRFVSRQSRPLIDAIVNMPLVPADSVFGTSRGTAIDRYYIHKFLEKNKEFIKGKCLEIAENTYTKRYGGNNVSESVILHVEGWGENVIKGNFETGDGIQNNAYDTMIITQTLMFIYDINSTVKNIYKALKKNGTAMITVAGISKISRYDDDNWGAFHSFYRSGLMKAFVPVFGKENIDVIHYGNVKTAISFLYGLTVEELSQVDFDYADEDYPVIYGIIAQKSNESL